MAIKDVVERATREPPYDPPELDFPGFHACTVFPPTSWEEGEITRELGFPIPAALSQLWRCCNGMRLFEDKIYGQWGLVVYSVEEMLVEHKRYTHDYARAALPGDLLVGGFQGDQDLVLLRCDTASQDFGSVVIMEEGPERVAAAASLESFLSRYLDLKGDKYWSDYYSSTLAGRQSVLKLRERLNNGTPLSDDEIERLLDDACSIGFELRSSEPESPGWILLGKVHPSTSWLDEYEGKDDAEVPPHVLSARQLKRTPYLFQIIELNKSLREIGVKVEEGNVKRNEFERFASLDDMKARLGDLGYPLEHARDPRALKIPGGL